MADFNVGEVTCEDSPDKLTWAWWPPPNYVPIGKQETKTLRFQATTSGNLPDGTYYNQAVVRYRASWTNPEAEVFTPYTAEVVEGTGDPKCGFNLEMLVNKVVEPQEVIPGEETNFMYTITVENVSSGTRHLCAITDLLPPPSPPYLSQTLKH